jgi:hypothetical protein
MSDALLRTARANIRRFVANADFKCGADKSAALSCLDVIEESLDGLSDTLTVTRDAFVASDKVRAAHIERIEALNAELREALETADRLLEQYRPLDDIEACQTFPEDRTPEDEALMFDRNRVRAALASATPTTEGETS